MLGLSDEAERGAEERRRRAANIKIKTSNKQRGMKSMGEESGSIVFL